LPPVPKKSGTEANPPRASKKGARRIAILWAVATLGACLMPGDEIPQVDVPLADKWVHFMLFGIQTLLLLWSQPAGRKQIAAGAFSVALFGILVEVLQWITYPLLHRQFDMGDIAANVIGVVLGATLFFLGQRFLPQKPAAL
jgi:VanZ family protein